MGKRRAGRELALRALYQIDVGKMDPEEALASAVEGVLKPASPEAALEGASQADADSTRFAQELVLGFLSHQADIDARIEHHARGWTLSRMAHVDRNVLRLAVFEICYLPDVPSSVAVDEAVELAKKYSTAESGRFVNGILGNLLRHPDGEAEEPEAAEEAPEGADQE